jgi:tRNA threonylcarbamoyladenosine biosynthesis protein TsaE
MPEGWELVQGGNPLSQKDLNVAADELLKKGQEQKVWLFYGELGAGKTTLIKIIAEKLGVTGGMSSPTFSIVNEYRSASGKNIYHFDFYRIRQEQEAFDIGTEEYFDSGNYCFIEWADRIPSLIPQQRIEVKIIPGPDPEHRILRYARHD